MASSIDGLEPPSVITKMKFQEWCSTSSQKEQCPDHGLDILLQKWLLSCLTKETQEWEDYSDRTAMWMIETMGEQPSLETLRRKLSETVF